MVSRTSAFVDDELKMGVLTLDRLWKAGVFKELAGWFPVVRPGGFGVHALFAAAVLYLSSGVKIGIRPFFERRDARVRSRIGALAGQRTLPTAGSISRALVRFDHDLVQAFVANALAHSLDEDLLAHPSVQHHDALGDGWHVIDIDPTVKAIRRRDLPEGAELAPGKRRAAGEPGYTGRKRGEARVRTVPALHDGAGQWLAMVMMPKEGSIVHAVRTLSQNVVESLVAKNVPQDRLILRGDGELGSAGALRAMMDSGARLVTRLPRNGLLQRERVMEALPSVRWYPLATGESGVPREAAELGTFTLHGATGAEDADAVVTVRVIVTRMPRTSEPDHGILVGKYQLELFSTTLDPTSWAAPDVVQLFHGRASIENRFAQEDREFDLGRTFSHHPPGQEWMVGVGLFLWNEQVVTGFRESGLPAMRPHRISRVLVGKVDPPAEPLPGPVDVVPAPPALEQVEVSTVAETEPSVDSNADRDARSTLDRILARAFQSIRTWPGWSFESGGIRCEQGRLLRPFSVGAPSKAGAARLAVRTEPWGCQGCPVRDRCFTGRGPYKQVARTITEEELALARAALAQLYRKQASPRTPRPRRRPAAPRNAVSVPNGNLVFVPAVLTDPGQFLPQPPRFLPAVARRQVRDRARGVDVRLRVGRWVGTEPLRHVLLNRDAADRAHRRRTLEEASAKWRSDRLTKVEATPQRSAG